MQEGAGPSAADEAPFDILIVNARVVDGAGNPWFRADVGVRGDRIAAVGRLSGHEAARTIDAGDRVVTPGFVDMMGQASLVLITDPPSAESKLRQGITTYLSGEGGSPAPQSAETQQSPPVIDGDTLRWRRYSEYFAILESFGIPINVVHDVGLTQVRRVVLGVEDVAPTPEQLEQMRALVREGMEDGAVGRVHFPHLSARHLREHRGTRRAGVGRRRVRRRLLHAYAQREPRGAQGHPRGHHHR